MRCLTLAVGILGFVFLTWTPLPRAAAADQAAKPMPQDSVGQSKEAITAPGTPVYKPPKRGVPSGRIGGGTRGSGDNAAIISVLAPDHVGLTTQEQPTLYWYISKPTTDPVELAIIHYQGGQQSATLVEMRIPLPVQAGVQRIRLADYGVHLAPGGQYQWFVTIAAKAGHRSRDIVAGGFIERVMLQETIQAQLAQSSKAGSTNILAESGIWYDAIMSISEQIDAAPGNVGLRRQRAALFQQVGLAEVAEYELSRSRGE